MAQFEQLQEIWQQQPRPRALAPDPAAIAAATRSFSRRHTALSAVKLGIVTGLLATGCRFNPSPWFCGGAAVIFVCAVLMIVLDWRSRRRIARLEFYAPSIAFVDSAIAGLAARRNPFRRQYWILPGILAGANMMLYGISSRPPATVQAAATLLCAASFLAGLHLRRRRCDFESRPLLNQLTALRRFLEESKL
jgi:hypothetical protein